MKKPETLINLLQELDGEDIDSSVEILKTSEAIIYPNDVDIDGIKLTGRECRILFANISTVERFIEALGMPKASLALFDLCLSSEVLEELERNFAAIDEG
jgi:hypothetical protein